MKKIVLIATICLVVACLVVPYTTASADVGPKPSVKITFTNMGNETCYGTLLSENSTTGPAQVWDGDEEHIYNNGVDLEIWRAFVNYTDKDGFYFLQWSWLCSETKQLNWNYYPPYTFKILLYFPETGVFVSGNICQRYAFDSYFTVDMSNVNSSSDVLSPEMGGGINQLQAEKSYNYFWEIFSLVCRVVLTIAIEVGLAWLFRLREKKVFLTILFTNVATQLMLNIALNVINYFGGGLSLIMLYLPFELVVFVVELVVFLIAFPKVSQTKVPWWKTLLYTFSANLLSFVLGLVIALFVPGIF